MRNSEAAEGCKPPVEVDGPDLPVTGLQARRFLTLLNPFDPATSGLMSWSEFGACGPASDIKVELIPTISEN